MSPFTLLLFVSSCTGVSPHEHFTGPPSADSRISYLSSIYISISHLSIYVAIYRSICLYSIHLPTYLSSQCICPSLCNLSIFRLSAAPCPVYVGATIGTYLYTSMYIEMYVDVCVVDFLREGGLRSCLSVDK